jgi:hypothetical protein
MSSPDRSRSPELNSVAAYVRTLRGYTIPRDGAALSLDQSLSKLRMIIIDDKDVIGRANSATSASDRGATHCNYDIRLSGDKPMRATNSAFAQH